MLYVLVVMHNITCGESAAIRSLQALDDRDACVLIYDNSDSDYGIRTGCEANGWIYLGGQGNSGLSAAYNAALDHLEAEKAEGFLCILDDDTAFDCRFTSDMNAAAKEYRADILLPVMKQNGRILSPWRAKGRKYFRTFEECAAEPESNILAFNSGMIQFRYK